MRKQEHPSSFNVPFLTRQLIAYIGNKRRLVPFLAKIFEEHRRPAGVTEFVDPFAGSGAVARLARLLGYRVAAADREEYAAVVCRAALSSNRSQADALLEQFGGLERAILSLNGIGSAAVNDKALPRGYIERNYAPRTTEDADYRTERLFYTTENARFLDAARDTVEAWLPPLRSRPGNGRRGEFPADAGWPKDAELSESDRRYTVARALLIAPVLYEASVHANTSGVFKAFHKGFGGHGRDALGRILAPARLEVPELIDGPVAHVEQADAAEFCSRTSADIVYLDPPYNQHQYGSNYFMLNTIARWDKPPVNDARAADGSLQEKAGIRPDWRETRSAFCYRKSALGAFRELLDSIDAGTIVLSYNTEGIVPLEELLDLLGEHGDVGIRSHDYVQYRGGRQSASRRTDTAEIAFVVERSAKARPQKWSASEASRHVESPDAGAQHDVDGQRLGDAQLTGTEQRDAGAQCNHGGQLDEGQPDVSGYGSATGKQSNGEHIARSFRVAALCRVTYVPGRVVERFGAIDARREISGSGRVVEFEHGLRVTMAPDEPGLRELSHDTLLSLEEDLQYCACRDNAEEIEVLLGILDGSIPTAGSEKVDSPPTGKRRHMLEKRALTLLRKLAHPRYRERFVALYRRFSEDPERAERNASILDALAETSNARLGMYPSEAHRSPGTQP